MKEEQYNEFRKESILEIRKALDNQYLTIFAGSGVSIDSNLPSWTSLIDGFKNALKTEERDFLKVAEMFFIQVKEKMYYSKIDSFFPEESKPNLIHDFIINLEPRNIITTNWDNLLEKSIVNNGKFFDTILKEDDICFSNNRNKLIKMHGDLKSRNIVFKESDYLNYSQNFPLIENYIKSLFSTDLVLLVGYSLSDFNVKQILSWVNKQSKFIKPVYFLKVGKSFDYLEFEYYKNQNVFIIYWNDEETNKKKTDIYEEDSNNKLSEIGKKTLSFLKKISIKNRDIESFTSSEDFISELYSALQPLENYNFIPPETIVKIIKKRFMLYGVNEIFYGGYGDRVIRIQNEKFYEYISELEKNKNSVFNKIKTILSKANIRRIEKYGSPDLISIPEKGDYFNWNVFRAFDYKELENRIDKLSNVLNVDGNEELFLEKAFLYYQNREFKKSYNILKQVSVSSFKNRKFDMYVISEFNRAKFCNLLRSENKYLNSEDYKKEIECDCREINSIDIQSAVNRIPIRYYEIVEPFLNIDNFLNQKLLNIISLSENVETDFKNTKKGILSFNYDIKDLINQLNGIDKFIQSNRLFLEFDGKKYRIFQDTFKGVIFYHLKRKSKSQSYEIEIDSNIVILATINFEHKKLYEFLYETLQDNQMLNLEKGSNLSVFLRNLKEKIISSKRFFNYTDYLLYNFITMLSFIKISETEFRTVIDTFNELLQKTSMNLMDFEVINNFIVNQYSRNIEIIETKYLEQIIKSYIYKIMSGRFNGYEYEAINHTDTFSNIFAVLRKIDKDYKFDDEKAIKMFLFSLENSFDLPEQYQVATVFLSELNLISNEKIKEIIRQYTETLSKNLEADSRYGKIYVNTLKTAFEGYFENETIN